jgi:protein PET100
MINDANPSGTAAIMGGPNLEVFKFGLYLFVPMFALLHFGDPEWYHNNVLPVGTPLFVPIHVPIY